MDTERCSDTSNHGHPNFHQTTKGLVFYLSRFSTRPCRAFLRDPIFSSPCTFSLEKRMFGSKPTYWARKMHFYGGRQTGWKLTPLLVESLSFFEINSPGKVWAAREGHTRSPGDTLRLGRRLRLREAELKGSIGEGPNHSNHSNHSNSFK